LETCLSEYAWSACAKTHLLISGVKIDVEKITPGKRKLFPYILNTHKYQSRQTLLLLTQYKMAKKQAQNEVYQCRQLIEKFSA